MTRLFDPDVYICPGCDNHFLHRRPATINFSGTFDWSDGAPRVWWGGSPLARCHHCAAIFWRGDIERVGVLPSAPWPIGRLQRTVARWRGDPKGILQEEQKWAEIPADWKAARSVGYADFDDILFVLGRSERLDREKILWLRRSVWWALNDRFRVQPGMKERKVPIMPETAERANICSLIDLLDMGEMTPRAMVQKGELLRHLGHFDAAVALLRAVPPDGHNEIRASKIERLARQRDVAVCVLDTEVR